MECDWEIELGESAAVIEPDWDGFIDLRKDAKRIIEIAEAISLPSLAHTLSRLNASDSGHCVYTSKCDVWRVEPSGALAADPFEFACSSEEALEGMACYIDLLPWRERVFPSLEAAEHWTTAVIAVLDAIECRCARIDLVIRRAVLKNGEGFGLTAYAQGCGASIEAAESSLSQALVALTSAVMIYLGAENSRETLQ